MVAKSPLPEELGDSPRRLSLLGSFRLILHGQPIQLPHSVERLVVFLALNGRLLSRKFISGHLWEQSTDDRAQASLRTVLWQLRSVDSEIVTTDRWRVGLSPNVRIDMKVMLSRAYELLEGNADPAGYQPDQFRNDLLPDWYEEWAVARQREVRQWRLQALESLASNDLERRRYRRAIRIATMILEADKINESAHRLVIHALLAQGNRAGALAHYGRYESLLEDELGLKPSGQITTLISDLEFEAV